MKILGAFLLVAFFTINGYSQTITFKVKGIEDTEVHLVKYVGSKLYYADTAYMKNETVSFDGSKQIPGIMALLLPGQRYFEIVYNDEDIDIETKDGDFVSNMVVKKSKENQLFLEYIIRMKDDREAAQRLKKRRDALDESAISEREELDKQIDKIGEEVLQYQYDLVKDNPSTLVAQIVKMSTDIQIPDAPKGNEESDFSYKYFRDHYFDNIDFTDDRLVNTPILQNKLEYFYEKTLPQHPDSIVKYISAVVNKIPEGTMMYRFFVTNITAHFEKSNIMGMDKVWNHMVHRFYCAKDRNGEYKGYWMDEEKLDDLCKTTEKRLRVMVGEVPPNLILPDSTNNNWYNLHELEADFTILYFWDPNCGHCKKVTPKLNELYTKKLKDRNIKVFSVGKATGDDFEAWKKFIRENNLEFIDVGVTDQLYKKAKENPYSVVPKFTTIESINYQDTYDIYSTPRVFILNKEKKIIAKSLSVAQIEHMLDDLQEGYKDAPKLFDIDEPDDGRRDKKQ